MRKKKPKKLRQVLEELIPLNVNVKINSGTNFLYCDKCDNNIFKTLEKMSIDIYNDLERKIVILRRYIKYFDKIWEKIITRRIAYFQKVNKPSVEELEEYQKSILEEKAIDFRRKKHNLADKIKNKNTYVPLLDREVTEVIDSIDIVEIKKWGDIKIIYTIGSDVGNYWTVSEYKKGIKLRADEREEKEDV